MTGAVPAAGRGSTRRGGLLVVAGWFFLALGALISVLIAGVPFLVICGLLGVACLIVGCHLLARGKANWVYPVGVLGGLAVVAGLGFGGQQLVLELRGTTVACKVSGVERSIGARRTASRVRYVHTVACPGEVYTMSAFPPYAAGDRVEVTYDPRGAVAPRFTDRAPAMARLVLLLVPVTAGGLTALALPFTAWRRGLRWAADDRKTAATQVRNG